MGSHYSFICTMGISIGGLHSSGREAIVLFFLPPTQMVAYPLSRFDTHPQARLGTFETKLASNNAKYSILIILEKIGYYE